MLLWIMPRMASYEEPEPEELPDTLDHPAEIAPAKKPPRPKVTFEKTAGARATRSNNPTVIRGLATSSRRLCAGLARLRASNTAWRSSAAPI